MRLANMGDASVTDLFCYKLHTFTTTCFHLLLNMSPKTIWLWL